MSGVDSSAIKAEVRAYYDSVGWTEIGEGLYQNARYEDLRPVAREYVHRCHLRVRRVLPDGGRWLLDAGSGPIQYPEYLEYSRGFQRRVCLDLSRRALVEARRRLGSHGRFVVGDMASLPFVRSAFDAIVSLHALHHVPSDEQEGALLELVRVAGPRAPVVVVYSWGERSGLMRAFAPWIALMNFLLGLYSGRRRAETVASPAALRAPGSHSFKHDHAWMSRVLARLGGGEILVWRSLGTALLRSLIHEPLLGRLLLRWVFGAEDRWPRWFGRHGAYPLIVLSGRETGDGGKTA
jgi:SAM-dependent methyltransferase